jgi:flagellin-like hook-associated protein FlgL
MRITQRAVTLTSLQGLERNLGAVAKLQQQLTSGRLVNAPSDSPTATNRSMQTRADQAALAQQARNISDAKGWLGQADSALQSMVDMTRRVRDLTVQGLSNGSASAASQDALSREVASLREALLSVANLKMQGGRPLFGGVTSGGAAYDATGGWVGESGVPITRRVSDSVTVRADITGPEAFGTPGDDLFAVVGRIATDMTDPTALAVHLDDLDAVMNGMLTALADVGARTARVERVERLNADRALTLSAQLSEAEDIDLPHTIMRLQMQQVGYEAALSATAKALQPTLLDFLR